MVVLVVSVILFAVLMTALFFLIRHTVAPQTDLPLNAEWIDELSIERYRPMMRLLDERDLEFLRAQPGFTPRMESRLRRERARIFQGYLRYLTADFRRVCTALKVVMLYQKQDRPDLASALVRAQLTFALGVGLVQARVLFYRCGLGSVQADALVNIFDGIQIELRSLVPASMAAAA